MLHIRLRYLPATQTFFVFSKDLKEPYLHTILRAFLFTFLPNISTFLIQKVNSVRQSIHHLLVEVRRFELLTYGLQSRRSPS